jgi:hypothetical protein
VVPKSASTGEIRALWLYVQDRLSRLKKEVHQVPALLTLSPPLAAAAANGVDGGAPVVAAEAAPLASDAAADTAAAEETEHGDEADGAVARPPASAGGRPVKLQSFGKRYAQSPVFPR